MTSLLLTALSPALFMLGLALLCGAGLNRRRAGWALLMATFLAVDGALLFAPGLLSLSVGTLNWSGKIASAAFGWTVLVLLVRRGIVEGRFLDPRTAGIRQWATAGVATLLFSTTMILLYGGAGAPPQAEQAAFQALLPGLDEEPVWRGVVLALLLRCLPQSEGNGMFWIAAIGSSLVFGLIHVIDWSTPAQPVVYWTYLPPVALSALLFYLLCRCTGNIWPAIAAHNVINLANVCVVHAGCLG